MRRAPRSRRADPRVPYKTLCRSKLIVLEGRRFNEYRKMNIPQAVCCPNGELAYRIHELLPDEETTVVINCAGRTRSIIGAQTLINLGIRNPVFALENGKHGRYLEGLELAHGRARKYGRPATGGAGKGGGIRGKTWRV